MSSEQSLSVSDRLEIHELVARYNRAVDAGPEDRWLREWVNTFTEDGEFDCVLGVVHGHAELYDLQKRLYTEPANWQYRGGQHWLSNIILTPNGEDVDLWATFLFFVPGPPAPIASLIGTYTDVVTKHDGKWLFARRKVNLIFERQIEWGGDAQAAPSGHSDNRQSG
jgi:hypothetical protein